MIPLPGPLSDEERELWKMLEAETHAKVHKQWYVFVNVLNMLSATLTFAQMQAPLVS
jgi:hypothetical protein